MNNFLPYVILFFAFVSVAFHYTGLGDFVVFPAAVGALLALLGMFFADPERPVSSRVACLLAAGLAASPLFAPFFQELRFRHLERQRARETAPVYATLQAEFETIKAPVDEYFARHGVMPDVYGGATLPMVDRNGQMVARPPFDFRVPLDPFHPRRDPFRWAAVAGEGVLVLSVGQDGVPNMALPGVMMDPVPPADPLSALAVLGRDPREATYDPTNGALSTGDVVFFHGPRSYDEVFAPLFAAWDKAHAASPFRPTRKRRANDPDPDPQSVRDAVGATRLLEQGEYLAALALASRAAPLRHNFVAQWQEPDYQVDRIRGIALYHLGAFREAADALIEYTWGRPNDAEAHYYLGAALFYGANRMDALTHLAAASQIDPASPVANTAQAAYDAIRGNAQPQFPVPWIVQQQRARE